MRLLFILAAVTTAGPVHAMPTVKRGAAAQPETARASSPPKTRKNKTAASATMQPAPLVPSPPLPALNKLPTLQGGVVSFALADLATPKNVNITGPNTLVIEIRRAASTTKSTKVRVSVDSRVNKILALKDVSTLHLVTLPAGPHVLTFAAALGKSAAGELVVRYKDGGGAAVVSDAAAAAPAAGRDVLNAPLVEVSGSSQQPVSIPRGSHLSAIAWATYGSEDMWPVLYEVNRARIGNDPNRVEEGTNLYLPDAVDAKEIMAWIRSGKRPPAPKGLSDTSRGTRLVVGSKPLLPPSRMHGEAIGFLPLRNGEAWSPLIAELLYERGKSPVLSASAARLVVSGEVNRQGSKTSVTLTLQESGQQVSSVQRSWSRGALDSELGAALDALFDTRITRIDTTAGNQPASASAAEPAGGDRYRSAALALTISGAAVLAAGAALLIANRLMISSVAGVVEAYNVQPIRLQATFTQIDNQRHALIDIGIASYVALGLGAAALTAGIVLFAIDGKKTLAFMPFGAGGSLAGTF